VPRVWIRRPSDFDAEWALAFLAARAVPAIERIADSRYVRSVRIGGRCFILSCRIGPGGIDARSSPQMPAPWLRRQVSQLFDLATDLAPFHAVARQEPLLRRVVERGPAVRVLQFLDPFEGMVRAILGQQVSLAAARTMADRLVRLFGRRAPPPPGNARLFAFPTARDLAAAGPVTLAGIGLTRAKAAALHGAAVAVRDHVLDWERLRNAPLEAAEDCLTSLPGVGPWTAAYMLMRVLGRKDAFPAGDLGLRHALTRARPKGAPWTVARIQARAEAWRPWRSYATLHLWASLAAP
jgi:3-methyladenine DNA glycosylase/8-oxoguanine DNA glycosylase